MPLTFEEVSAAYKAAMNDKDSGPLKRILADDFRWKMFARKDGASANKEQTVYWNLHTDMTQTDYKTVYNGEDLVIGTFNISVEGEEDTIVVSIGHLSDDGTQVTVCEHLRGPYTGGKDSKPSLSFFL
jgi:hypothetical protein